MAAAAAAGQAAALPWAAVQLEGGEAPAVDRDLPATLGLQLGSRVEVQWSIHVEQEGGGEAETTKARRCCAGLAGRALALRRLLQYGLLTQ